MDVALGYGDLRPVTSTAAFASASASQPPVESYLAHDMRLNSADYYNSHGGASVFSPFSDLGTLESEFSQMCLSDFNAQHHQPPLWNSGGPSNQGFVGIQRNNVGGYMVPPIPQQETGREQINQLHTLRFQNDSINGSLGFDDSGHRGSLTGQDILLSNGFSNDDLKDVPYLSRNSLIDQSPWDTTNGSMFRNSNPRRNGFGSLENSANMTVMMMAKHQRDQTLYHRLRHAIVEGPTEMFDRIFNNVFFHVCELMVDPFCNHVVQKLIERCTDEQINQILAVVTRDPLELVYICNNSHGTRAIQTLLRCLRSAEQISRFMAALSPMALPLAKNADGGHVILFCLSRFPLELNMPLLQAVARNCYQIAIDQYGCCVLQHCITSSRGELKQCFIGSIIVNALRLANHCYGNYMVQYAVEQMTDPRALLIVFQGSFSDLSCDKYGSHVVQKLLSRLGEEDSRRVVFELLGDINMLLTDPFGNYVMQTAWAVSREDIREVLTNYIRQNDPLMRCNRYGRKVLQKLKCF